MSIKKVIIISLLTILVPFHSIVSADDLSNNSLVEDEEFEDNSLVESESEDESDSESEGGTEESGTEEESDGTVNDGEVIEEGEYEVTESSDGSMSASTTSINPLFVGLAVVGVIGIIAVSFVGRKKK